MDLSVGVSEEAFMEAIPSFRGASKRLERLAKGKSSWLFKDFAHAPSKVQATTAAVKKQFESKKVLACLELHTYSSLNPEFIPAYQNTMDAADEAFIFYDPAALKIKNRPDLSVESIEAAFQHPNLKVFTQPEALHQQLQSMDYQYTVLLMMSSGNYGTMDWEALIRQLTLF